MKNNTKWFLIPRQIIDEKKYRGKGRPRKSDYRMYPDKERDFCTVGSLIWEPEDFKGIVMSIGDAI